MSSDCVGEVLILILIQTLIDMWAQRKPAYIHHVYVINIVGYLIGTSIHIEIINIYSRMFRFVSIGFIVTRRPSCKSF